MPTAKRSRIEPTDDWQEIQALAPWAEQRTYEQLRPVVLFGRPIEERARETATAERTLYRRVARFDAAGMASLFPPPKVEKHRRLPDMIRRAIHNLKAEHPPLRGREIADICAVRFGHRPSPHTVKRLLAEDPAPPRATRRFPRYEEIGDAAGARLAIIRLHSEGWPVKAIAAYLACSRQQVYRTLRRWIAEGVNGLDDKSRARTGGPRVITLGVIATVKELQENPRLGAFRLSAALRQQGIIVSQRTCGRILAKHRALYGRARPDPTPRDPKPLPFLAARPHEYWFLDIRYLDHGLGGGRVYSLTVIDGYSRAVLASMLSRSQDLAPVLLLLYSAIRHWGIPDALVTDSGGVFLANHAQRIYAALGIRKEEIARRQAWQNLLEAQFGTQARMADYAFAQASTWDGLLRVHEQWMDDYNAQMHWAHQRRPDGWRSPWEVLDGAQGRPIDAGTLRRAFFTLRYGRTLDVHGHARFRHWKIYGERGLAGCQVGLWLYDPQLTIEHWEEPLTQYRVTHAPGKRQLKAVTIHRLFETPFRSPQPGSSPWTMHSGERPGACRPTSPGVSRIPAPPPNSHSSPTARSKPSRGRPRHADRAPSRGARIPYHSPLHIGVTDVTAKRG